MSKIPLQVQRAAEKAHLLLNQQKEEEEVVVEEVETPTVEAVDWEHKFKTVNGMLQAEATRHKATVERYETQLSALKQEMEALKSEARSIKQAKNLEFTDADLGITPEMLDGFDPDSVNLIRTATANAMKQAMSRVKQDFDEELAPLKAQAATASKRAEVTEEEFLTKLGEIVPDWTTVNEHPSFLEWLAEVDSLTGHVRDVHLKNAAAALDAVRVGKIFKAWKDTQSVTQRKPTTQPTSVPASGPTTPSMSNLTAEGYKKFLSEVARGMWKSRPEARKKLEEQYEQAYRTGTLRR